MGDSSSAHGSPLPEAEVSATKLVYGWPHETFLLLDEALSHLREQLPATLVCSTRRRKRC